MKKLCAVFCVLGLAGLARGAETEVKLDDTPGWVRHTLEQAMPGAKISKAQLDTDDIDAVFEFKGMSKDNKAVEIDVRPDGSLQEIETVIEASEVPAPVQTLFEAKFPNFQLTKIELSQRPTRCGLREIWYEYDGKTKDGEAVDVEVNDKATAYLVEPD